MIAVLVILGSSEGRAVDCHEYWAAIKAGDPAGVRTAAERAGPLQDGAPCVSALQHVVRSRQWAMVAAFLGSGTHVDVRAADGSTALMWAARAGHVDTVASLQQAGAKLEAVDSSGQTALFHAADAQNIGAVHLLLNAGADVLHQDNFGRTAADVARFRRFYWRRLGIVGQYPRLFDTEVRRTLRNAARRVLSSRP
jgi:hypothetical protein